jgi:hypothetical protein
VIKSRRSSFPRTNELRRHLYHMPRLRPRKPKSTQPQPKAARNPPLNPEPEPEPVADPKPAKNPLQDITDQFVDSSPPPSPVIIVPPQLASTPAPRKRRPKVPSTLARQRILRSQQQPQQPVVAHQAGKPAHSSLPPSSPPSASSHNAHIDIDTIPEEFELQRFDSPPAHLFFQDDDYQLQPTPASDPFGFLAVERKLKAARAERDDEDMYEFFAEGDSSIDDIYFDEGNASVHIFPTPMPRARNRTDAAAETGRNRIATPAPCGRPRKRRPLVSPGASAPHLDSDGRDGESSFPSTPSPAKHSANVSVESPAVLDLRRHGTGARREKKAEGSGREDEPVGEAETKLPLRPRRAGTRATARKGEVEGRARPKKGGKGKGKAKAKNAGVKGKPQAVDCESEEVCVILGSIFSSLTSDTAETDT